MTTIHPKCALLFAFASSLAALTFMLAPVSWAESIGADFWNVPALTEQIRESTSANERLAAEQEEIRERIALKEAFIEELLAGRTTLAEVTEKFMTLNSSRPHYMDAIRDHFPGDTDQEKMARNVISIAIARSPTERQDSVTQYLESELNLMIATAEDL